MPVRLIAAVVAGLLLVAARAQASDPNNTIAQSEQVIAELLAIPGRQIPANLLNEAQGVAIIPRVIKIGFVAGVRRGHGVMLARDSEGHWSLPRFVRLTGGSVGWQAGVQGTDVVLVFRTRRSIETLMRGKFTIGVDAAAAAGPVGRNAAAATDATLSAEILSWSRSRGLFLGASVDGSVIEIDNRANAAFYGSDDIESPVVIPLPASRLQMTIVALSGGQAVVPGPVAAAPANVPLPLDAVAPAANFTEVRSDVLRRTLVADAQGLSQLLSPEWQVFLALPGEAADPAAPANLPALAELQARFDRVADDPQFSELAARPEFQSTRELLREYVAVLQSSATTLRLPPPPTADADRR
ncbi:MAG TPA: lipid-binding SYLF domain-containing protein [Lacipirellulaceae bacterium]|nr:lipid-binding SYLF domain-containing protein [Lacipirellulaceae bacterium]HMP06588.1 lipid-binding SYLF domain-containing protein [Lacipirellulaceae bacterium]